MRAQTWLWIFLVLGVPAAAPGAESSPPPDYQAPGLEGVCPALAEDHEICSEDKWSANCAGFVAAAARLGEAYRFEVQTHPGWAEELKTTHWWACGTADLGEIRSLLERIDSDPARAVLADEPYRSLAPAAAPEPEAEPRSQPQQDCNAPATEAERAACGARNVEQAKSQHERAFSACKQKVAPALRQELVDAEASWQKMLPLECAGSGTLRDSCLVRAYEERTQSIATMHAECRASSGTN